MAPNYSCRVDRMFEIILETLLVNFPLSSVPWRMLSEATSDYLRGPNDGRCARGSRWPCGCRNSPSPRPAVRSAPTTALKRWPSTRWRRPRPLLAISRSELVGCVIAARAISFGCLRIDFLNLNGLDLLIHCSSPLVDRYFWLTFDWFKLAVF